MYACPRPIYEGDPIGKGIKTGQIMENGPRKRREGGRGNSRPGPLRAKDLLSSSGFSHLTERKNIRRRGRGRKNTGDQNTARRHARTQNLPFKPQVGGMECKRPKTDCKEIEEIQETADRRKRKNGFKEQTRFYTGAMSMHRPCSKGIGMREGLDNVKTLETRNSYSKVMGARKKNTSCPLS